MDRDILTRFSLTAAPLSALFALGALLLALNGSVTLAAPSRAPTTDPAIHSVSVTASLPVSDTNPGAAISRTVYFNNRASGVLTLTFDITGTPALTFTAGAAFGQPARAFTATTAPWTLVLTYQVGLAGGDWPAVTYTVVNTDGVHATVALTYVRDITPSIVFSPSILEMSDQLCTAGVSLYYTNTMPLGQTFAVRGYSTDSASGVERVEFSPALGSAPPDDTDGFSPWQSGSYVVEQGETRNGVITATVYDQVGNVQVQTYTYALDGAGPYTGSVVINGGAPYVTQTNAVTLALFSSDTGCGVAQMCISNGATCTAWATFAPVHSWTLDDGDGLKEVYVWFKDEVGNVSAPYSTTIFADRTPPKVTVTVPLRVATTAIPIRWQAVDPMPGSGLTGYYDVDYREDDNDWQSWLVSTLLTSTTFPSASLETSQAHTYTFRVTACDQARNCSSSSGTSRVEYWHAYLPSLLRTFRPFTNGDFAAGLEGWTVGKGSFGGHGTGLPSSTANQQALLGEPGVPDGSIHVGYGFIAQTFTVQNRYLQLEYQVQSYDIARGTQRYYDTFEVTVDLPPNEVGDDDRGTRCATLNPTDVITVPLGGGLVFCGGRPDTTGMGSLWNSTWRTVTLDLEHFEGKNMTIYFAIWSREYEAPFYDNHAWYNTWAYVDDVTPHD